MPFILPCHSYNTYSSCFNSSQLVLYAVNQDAQADTGTVTQIVFSKLIVTFDKTYVLWNTLTTNICWTYFNWVIWEEKVFMCSLRTCIINWCPQSFGIFAPNSASLLLLAPVTIQIQSYPSYLFLSYVKDVCSLISSFFFVDTSKWCLYFSPQSLSPAGILSKNIYPLFCENQIGGKKFTINQLETYVKNTDIDMFYFFIEGCSQITVLVQKLLGK